MKQRMTLFLLKFKTKKKNINEKDIDDVFQSILSSYQTFKNIKIWGQARLLSRSFIILLVFQSLIP